MRKKIFKDFFKKLSNTFYPRRGWRRAFAYYKLRIIRIAATPHSIAMGFAVGGCLACTPLFGLHMVLALIFAWLLRGSRVAALVSVNLVGNPFALPFYWYISYQIGVRLIGMEPDIQHGIHHLHSLSLTNLLSREMNALFQTEISALFNEVFMPTLLGSIIVGLILGILCYTSVYYAVRAYQYGRGREGRHARKHHHKN